MSVFYVYEHWRPDLDVCFYVGKGKKARAYKIKERNLFHEAIQGKLARLGMCVEVRMVAYGLTEKEAFAIERERIAFWRNNSVELANVTDGGDGFKGMPAHNRRAVTCLSDGKIFPTIQEAAAYYSVSMSCIVHACNGNRQRETVKGLFFVYGARELTDAQRTAKVARMRRQRIVARKRVDTPQAHGSISNGRDAKGRKANGPASISIPIRCLDEEIVFPSASEAARHYGVCKSAVIELCLGKRGRKTVGGHRFQYVGMT